MNYRKWITKTVLILLSLCFLSGAAWAGIPDVSQVMVTDVTTRSFSVIWATSEAATADLSVYEDEDGVVAVNEATVTAHPVVSWDAAIKTAAEDNGVMKVQVTGLEPDTTYYFQTQTTSKSTADTVLFPETTPLLPVTTEFITVRTVDSGGDLVPFSNDVIIHSCFLSDGETPATGTLLLATVEGANYPLTAFVGDGVDAPDALIDLNNAFGFTSHENLDLEQGENLTLLNFRGIEGNAVVTYDVPEDASLAEVKPPAYSLKAGWNMVALPLDPTPSDTATVLSPILDVVNSLWAFNGTQWISYDKDNPPFLNDLNVMDSAVGYWINVTDDVSLPVQNGSFITNGISLMAGWNLVGSAFIETLPLADAVNSISEILNAIWTFDVGTNGWLSYDKDNPPFLNTLNVIQPGVSYWVHVEEDTVWY